MLEVYGKSIDVRVYNSVHIYILYGITLTKELYGQKKNTAFGCSKNVKGHTH